MAGNFTIKETDVYRVITEELNDNSFSEKIKFSMAGWNYGVDANGEPNSLLISKIALTKDDITRFDIKNTFNENTYAQNKEPFVAFDVGGLNGEFIALNTIKDVVYSPVVSFLVYVGNDKVHRLITLAIEEVRARLIQYERTFTARYHDTDNPASTDRVEETLKIIITSGTIDFGDLVQISGKQYLTYTLPLTIEVTNFGEFANQQNIYLGTSALLDTESNPIMYPLEPDSWFWGLARGVESAQLLPDKASPSSSNGKEIKSVQKNKGFGFNLDIEMDLQNSTNGALMRFLYKDSIQEKLTEPIMYLKVEMKLYNSSTGLFEVDSDLTMERPMILTQNQPNEELSKGEKIVFSLVLTPLKVAD